MQSNSSDEVLLEFLQSKVNSFIKWDLVRFFHDNPHTRDTAETIARYTSRDVRTVERELKGLVSTGVLRSEAVSGLRIYSLSQDERTRQFIEQFMAACQRREFRVKAIHHVIQAMQFTPRHDF
jgi:hypothetical protein